MYKLLCCITLGLVIGYNSPQMETKPIIAGSSWVNQIEADYKAGKYTTFLNEMERWYQAGHKVGRWKPLQQSEEELANKYNSQQGKKLFDDLIVKSKNYNNALNQLKRERNMQLLKVANANQGTPLSQLIKDKLTYDLKPDQLKAFEQFQEWLSPFPLHEPTPLLTQLKQVNFESTVKELLLNAAYQQSSSKAIEIPFLGKLDESLIDEYQVVLTLEKLNKMQNLSKQSKEQDIVQIVNTVSQSFPLIAAQIYDTKSIEKQAATSTTQEEREVANILRNYENQKVELLKKHGLKK